MELCLRTGICNVVTVFIELAERLNADRLVEAAAADPTLLTHRGSAFFSTVPAPSTRPGRWRTGSSSGGRGRFRDRLVLAPRQIPHLAVPDLLDLRAATAIAGTQKNLVAALPPHPEPQRPRLLIDLVPADAISRPVQNLGELSLGQPCEFGSPVHIPLRANSSIASDPSPSGYLAASIGSLRDCW